jgi:IS5 family transposase
MARKSTRSWSEVNRSLVKQGSIIFWIQDKALKGWVAEKTGSRGRPQVYSRHAILALLIVRAVFGCPFRQLQGLMTDILLLMGLTLPCPDYTTICRRASSVRVPFKRRSKGPLTLVLDSTGLKVFGEGEWRMEKHGPSRRRGWKKLHIGMCAETGEILVSLLTDKEVSDSHGALDMLDAVAGDLVEVIGDGAYDTYDVRRAIHTKGAKGTIPPRQGARKSRGDPALADRDRAIHRIRDQKRGKRRWKQEEGYHRRSLFETAMHRFKAHLGPNLRARTLANQGVEMAVKIHVLNEMRALR